MRNATVIAPNLGVHSLKAIRIFYYSNNGPIVISRITKMIKFVLQVYPAYIKEHPINATSKFPNIATSISLV